MLTKLKLTIREHYKIIIFALVMGVLSSVPYYISSHSVNNFQGIYNQMGDDVDYYRVRAKEVLDGHVFLTNPYTYEHKDGFPVQFWVPDVVLAVPIGLLHISIPDGFVLWNLFLTPILVLLSYYVFFSITGSKSWSLIGAVVFHLCIFYSDFLRLPSPGLNFIFLLLSLLFLIFHIKNPTRWNVIGSSVTFGLLFHIYPWYWTFYITLFFIFVALSLILKVEDFPYKNYAKIFIGGVIIGSPYFLFLLYNSRFPAYSEMFARSGGIHSHFPSGIASVIPAVFVIIAFLIAYRKKSISRNTITVFLFSGLLAVLIAVNQHVITGLNLQFSSHYIIGNIFIVLLGLSYLLSVCLKNSSEVIKKAFLVIIGFIVLITGLWGVYKLVSGQMVHSERQVYIQNYAPVFNWLNTHMSKDQVVFADDDISGYIPLYTSGNVFSTQYNIVFLMEKDEIEKRFIINHYFDNFTHDYILTHYRPIFGVRYLDQYNHNLSKNKLRKLFGLKEVPYTNIPESEISRVVDEAKAVQSQSFEKDLKVYRVDYLVWDTNKEPEWRLERFSFLKQVYSDAGIVIYRVN